jgi:hypothetical protein
VERHAIEGKFGEGKTLYGLNRIMARMKHTSETVIALSFLCMNISKRLRVLPSFFWNSKNLGLFDDFYDEPYILGVVSKPYLIIMHVDVFFSFSFLFDSSDNVVANFK